MLILTWSTQYYAILGLISTVAKNFIPKLKKFIAWSVHTVSKLLRSTWNSLKQNAAHRFKSLDPSNAFICRWFYISGDWRGIESWRKCLAVLFVGVNRPCCKIGMWLIRCSCSWSTWRRCTLSWQRPCLRTWSNSYTWSGLRSRQVMCNPLGFNRANTII